MRVFIYLCLYARDCFKQGRSRARSLKDLGPQSIYRAQSSGVLPCLFFEGNVI